MEHVDWGALLLAACALITLARGYLWHPPTFVSRGRLEDLQNVVDELRTQNADLRRERDEYRTAFQNAERSRANWQRWYEELEEKHRQKP